MIFQIYPHIRTPTDLGIAYLGDPRTSIVPVQAENRVDRAEYGRVISKAEGGVFTPQGYVVPRQTPSRNNHYKSKKRR